MTFPFHPFTETVMEVQKRIKIQQMKEIFGGCSTATIWRMWNIYKVLPPPTKIRGINYWTPEQAEAAFNASQQAGIPLDTCLEVTPAVPVHHADPATTPTQAVPAPTQTANAARAANARRGRKPGTGTVANSQTAS